MSFVRRYGLFSGAFALLLVVLLPSVSLPSAWNLLSGKTVGAGPNVADLTLADFDNDGIPDIICVNHQNNGSFTYLTGKGDATFEKKMKHDLLHDPIAIASADFNKDGNMDLVMCNWDDNTISVLLGRGDKTFDDPVDYLSGLEPGAVEVTDLNNDGKTDIVVGCLDGGSVWVYLGNGDGTFADGVEYPAGAKVMTLVAGDLVGDSNIDIACTNWDDNTVTILSGDGSGALTYSKTIRAGNRPWTVEAADFNIDGKKDLAVSNTADDTVYIYLNSDAGFDNFTSVISAPSYTLSTNSGPAAVKAALMGNDRFPDLLVTDALANNLTVFMGKGDGNFDLYSNFYTTLYPASVVAGDFDGDLLTDDAVGAYTSGIVSLNKGHLAIEGRWAFQPYTTASPPSYPAGLAPSYLTTGDFNGDTRPDIIAADSADGRNILPGNGLGALGTASAYTDSVIHTPTCSPDVDLNGDLRLDHATAVFTTATTAGYVEVQYRLPDDTFSDPVDYPVGIGPDCVYAVDLNKDGFLDLVTTNTVGVVPEGGTDPVYSVSVLINNQMGGFLDAVSYQINGLPVGISIGDLETDSYPDLVVPNIVASDPDHDRVTVMMNTNGSGFSSFVNYDVGKSPGHVLIFDLNRDGRKDLAVPDKDNDNVFLLLSNTTNNVLTPQTPLKTGPAPVYVIACDLDMNGLPDLAVANSGDSTISVILSEEKSTLSVAVNDGSMGSVDINIGATKVDEATSNTPTVQEYDTGTTFTLTPVPAPGYTFTGWSGDVKTRDNPLSLSLHGDKTLTANFAAGPYITGISPDNGIMGDVVTIDGTTFGASGSVKLDGKKVKPISWSDTQIVFTVPTKVTFGTKAVDITNGDLKTIGTTSFEVRRAAITGILPASAEPGAPVTINGTDFGTGKLKVTFYNAAGSRKGAKVTAFVPGSDSATVTVPKLAPGTYWITVRNSHGESLKAGFTVEPAP